MALAAITVSLLATTIACGDVARPGAPGPSPTAPVVVNAEGVPGAAGQPLGPYTPGSDVSFEVRTNAATEQLVGILSDPTFVDWDSVREGFEAAPAPVGGAIPPTLSAVTFGAATGPLGASYIEHFGSRDWLQARALDTITGSGDFASLSDTDRAADLANLLSIELPLIRALVAAEAGERLTEAGDLDPRFGAPHEWDRLWVILQGAAPLSPALTEDTLTAIRSGADAAASGDTSAARAAHDVVRVALVRTALESISDSDPAAATAFLRGIEPVLTALDSATTSQLRDHLETDDPFDVEAVRGLVAQLADRAGIKASFVSVES